MPAPLRHVAWTTCLLLLALPQFSVHGQEDGGPGQAFQIMGREFHFKNNATSGSLNFRRLDNGELKYLNAAGAIELRSTDFELFCRKLVYDGESGELSATGAPAEQVRVNQQGTTAHTDKMIYLAEHGRTELLGNARIEQLDAESVTRFFGDLIVRVENADGTASINVQKNPLMQHFPNPAAADHGSTDTAQTGGAAIDTDAKPDADADAAAGVHSGLGRNVELRADPQNGVFDVVTGAAGGVRFFRAYRRVRLQSDRLDLDCDQLDLLDNGETIDAIGSPALIRQGTVHADCHRFQHLRGQKKSILTGKPAPRIFQSEDSRNILMSAPKIILTEDERGEVSIDLIGLDLQQQEKSGELPQFEIQNRPEAPSPVAEQSRTLRLVPGL